jgi:hypothetical protein
VPSEHSDYDEVDAVRKSELSDVNNDTSSSSDVFYFCSVMRRLTCANFVEFLYLKLLLMHV